MTLIQLKYFVELAQNGDVQTTAHSLFVTRQTIASAIHSIEEEFQQRLFDNSRSPLRLSPFGKFLFNGAVSLLRNYEQLCTEAKSYSDNRISLLTPHSFLLYFPQIFNRIMDFCEANPDIVINFMEVEYPEKLLTEVLDYKNDCSISLQIGEPKYSNIMSTIIAQYPLFALVSKDHPLGQSSLPEICSLSEYPLIFFENGDKYYNSLMQHLGHKVRFLPVSNMQNAVQQLLRAPNSVLLVKENQIATMNHPKLTAIPLPNFVWTVSLNWMSDSPYADSCKRLGEFLQEETGFSS